MKAIIFDFNGTLLKDAHIHTLVWRQLIKERTGYEMSEEEFMNKAWGKDNTETIKEFLHIHDKDKIDKISKEKERIYRLICKEEGLELVAGAYELFDYLKENDIKMNIATGSIKENLEFYFSHYHLSKWFDINKVIYNDGIIPSKPDPMIILNLSQKV